MSVELLSYVKCQECGREFKSLKGLATHITNSKPCAESIQDYYDRYLKKSPTEGHCAACDKPTAFHGLGRGYNRYCSIKCSINAPEVQNKINKTMMKKFGTIHPLQSKVLLKKAKQTWMKNMGVENPGQSKVVKERIKQTWERIGNVGTRGQSPELEDRKRKTCLERYGVENPAQIPEVKVKIKKAIKKKFGAESLLHIPAYQVMIQQARKAKKEAQVQCQQ